VDFSGIRARFRPKPMTAWSFALFPPISILTAANCEVLQAAHAGAARVVFAASQLRANAGTKLAQRSEEDLMLKFSQAEAVPRGFESLCFRHFFLQRMDL